MIEHTTLPIQNVEHFKQQVLCWANQFSVCCLLDSNNYAHQTYRSFEWKMAVDAIDFVSAKGGNGFSSLKAFFEQHRTEIFGLLSYDLKNETENLETRHTDFIGFPDLYFFKPRYVIELMENKIRINRNYPEAFAIVEQILQFKAAPVKASPPQLQLRTNRSSYLKQAQTIKQKIVEGDFYEMNFCIEAFDAEAHISPTDVFQKLNAIARAPFSAFFKCRDSFLMCASPERFLKKEGTKLISQPIKGTVRKSENENENERLKTELQNSEKERAENVMIVDLVRNDLARSSKPGSVKVEELFGIYTFATVHQMISTVTSEIAEDVHFIEAIKHAFPMGSMTGAPKIEVMKTIDEMEHFRRGIFSGAVGYIDADGNFDFNVVIRSVLYNAASNYLSVRAGSAITFDADAEQEWDEVMLKLAAMKKSLA